MINTNDRLVFLVRTFLLACMPFCGTGLLARNVIPNGSFEERSATGSESYATNDREPYVTDAWRGGILTKTYVSDQTVFCSAPSIAGVYAMALHKDYPSTEVSFSVAVAGTYDFSFRYATRALYCTPCGQYVAAVIDEAAEPICRVMPSAVGVWDAFRTTISLSAGTHTLKFIGELAAGVADSATVIDLVSLEYAQGANLVPNHSFERDTMIGHDIFRANDANAPVTRAWTGGIVTKGKTAYCALEMADEVHGLALAGTHGQASCAVHVPNAGTYRLSFKYAPCRDSANNPTLVAGAMGIAVRLDGNEVARCATESGADWQICDTFLSLAAGEHTLTLEGVLSDGVVNSAATVDFVSLLLVGENVLPNGGFEEGSSVGTQYGYAVNDSGQATSGWIGGVLTAGRKTMCSAAMAEGTYGMALHDGYPTLTRTFEASEPGEYTMRFMCVGRSQGNSQLNLRVSVFVDDLDNPVYVFLPRSVSAWDTHEFCLPLTAGSHTVIFRGTLVDPARTDSATVIDDISVRRVGHGVFATVIGGTGAVQPAIRVPGVFVDENDALSFMASRAFDGDDIYGAYPEVKSASGLVRTRSGWYDVQVGTSPVAVRWPYARIGTFSAGLIPNGSFEEGSATGSESYAPNDSEPYVTDAWRGGILTKVYAFDPTLFCSATKVAGSYAMALHKDYPSVETSFSVPFAGAYDFSFLYATRSLGGTPCGQRVTLYIDDTPVTSVIPSRVGSWYEWIGRVDLSAGRHTVRFTGMLENGVSDSSTVIEAVFLAPAKQKGLVLVFK